MAGALAVREGGELAAKGVDGDADGVEEGGAAARDVAAGVELGDAVEGLAIAGDEVLVVEEDKAEAGAAGGLALGCEEFIEAGDGGFFHSAHGARAVEDVGDFGEVFVHGGFLVVKVL